MRILNQRCLIPEVMTFKVKREREEVEVAVVIAWYWLFDSSTSMYTVQQEQRREGK